MKKKLIVVLAITVVLLCSCIIGDELEKASSQKESKVSISLVSCSTVESYKSFAGYTKTPRAGNQFKKLVVDVTNNYDSVITFAYGNSYINFFKVELANGHQYSDELTTGNWPIMPGSTMRVTDYFEIQEGENLNKAKLTFVFMDPSNPPYSRRSTITLGSSVDI